jgi:hypothetical protein
VGGAKVSYEVPQLPNTTLYSNKLDIYDLFWDSDFSNLNYKAFMPETNSFVVGAIDEHGRTEKISTSDPTKVQVLVGSNDEWGLIIDSFDEDDFFADQNKSADCSEIKNDAEDKG